MVKHRRYPSFCPLRGFASQFRRRWDNTVIGKPVCLRPVGCPECKRLYVDDDITGVV